MIRGFIAFEYGSICCEIAFFSVGMREKNTQVFIFGKHYGMFSLDILNCLAYCTDITALYFLLFDYIFLDIFLIEYFALFLLSTGH